MEMTASDNSDKDGTAEVYDLALFREIERKRSSGELSDADRVSVSNPDDTVRLHSAFGHGARDETFAGICRANFIALNRSRFGDN